MGVSTMQLWHTIENLENALEKLLTDGKNILISGDSGIGKSQIFAQVCKRKGKTLEIIPAYDYGEFITGLPKVNSVVTSFTKAEWVHNVLSNKPDVILFEDAHLIRPEYLNHFYTTLLERQFQGSQLPPESIIVMIGNWGVDSAMYNDIPAPIMGRIDYCFNFIPNPDLWIKWGKENGIHEYVLNYIDMFKNDFVRTTNFNEISISPRKWEKFSNDLKSGLSEELYECSIGIDLATKFKDFSSTFTYSLDDILKSDFNMLNENQKIGLVVVLALKYNYKTDSRILQFIKNLDEDKQTLWVSCTINKLKTEEQPYFVLELKQILPQLYDIYVKKEKLK